MRVLYPDILKHLLKLIAEVAPVPSLSVTPANSTVQLSGNYTLVMADAGPVGTDESQGQTRHWLVNGVTVAWLIFAVIFFSFPYSMPVQVPSMNYTCVVVGSLPIMVSLWWFVAAKQYRQKIAAAKE